MKRKISIFLVLISLGTVACYSFQEDNTAIEYGLFKAWSVWINGRLAASDTVFGVPVLWWGRLGKIADFLAAILLLWDLGTSTWVRGFSIWLRESKTWWSSSGDKSGPRQPRGASFVIHCIICFGLLGGVFLPLWWVDNYDPSLVAWYAWADATFIRRLTLLAPVVIFPGIIGVIITYGLLIFPLVWLTEIPRMPPRIRLVALSLLLFGVHFSLLAS